jgi:hypothetical protein
MGYDKDGKPLQVGDRVQIPCRITALLEGVDYCNCVVETQEPMYPSRNKTGFTLNTRQLVKTEEAS